MSNTFESISTGVVAHIGRYADAVRIPAGRTSSIRPARPVCVLMEPCRRTSPRRSLRHGAMSKKHLRRAGAALTDIVSVRQWLTDAADIPAYAAARSKVIKHEPVFMLAVIPALVWPNIRVEVEVTAIREW
jgi:2-iminobutanoate/2-iminopropanoate deaminase